MANMQVRGNDPLKGVRGRKMLTGMSMEHTKFGAIFSRSTALSAGSAVYKGHDAQGGLHANLVQFYRRPYSTSSELSYTTVDAYDLMMPWEFLCANTAAPTTDPATKVGLDEFNAPFELISKIRTIPRTSAGSSTNAIWQKTNWAKHRFMFTNYSRHPIKLYVEYCLGPTRQYWATVNNSLVESAYAGQTINQLNYPDQYRTIESYVLPGTLDNGDAGNRTYVDINLNFNELFGEDYSKAEPNSDNQYPDNGPWRRVQPDYFEGAAPDNITLPYFLEAAGDSNACNAQGNYQARVRFHLSVMDAHGGLYKTDKGVTAVDGRATLDSDAVNIEVDSTWDVTIARPGVSMEAGHAGDRARLVE